MPIPTPSLAPTFSFVNVTLTVHLTDTDCADYDREAERILIGALAASCDVLNTNHMNSTVCAAWASGRRQPLASGVEIDVPIVAPFVTAEALGEAVVDDMNEAIDDGSFVGYLQSFNSTVCYINSVAEAAYLYENPPTAAPTRVPATAAPRTATGTGRYRLLTIVLIMACVGFCIFGLIMCSGQKTKKDKQYGRDDGEPGMIDPNAVAAVPRRQEEPLIGHEIAIAPSDVAVIDEDELWFSGTTEGEG